MSKVYLQWLGQSGYRIWDRETEILLDPYLSDSVERVAGRPRLLPVRPAPTELTPSLVVCTHEHLDHLDPDTLAAIPNKKVPVLVPSNCIDALKNLHYENVKAFDSGEVVTVDNFTLTAVPAAHSVNAVGVVISFKDIHLYFTGDTLFCDELCNSDTKRCDMLFVCINGKLGNMGIVDAAKLTRMIIPGIAVPNHYGMFDSNTADPEMYAALVPNCQILEPYTVYTIEKKREVTICSVT